MNFPRIYRRLAMAAIAALVVGLMPSVALADGGQTEWFGVQFSAASVVAGNALDVTVTAYADASRSTPDTGYAGTVTFSSSDARISVGHGLPGNCTFDGSTGVCTDLAGVTFETADSQTVTVTQTDNFENTVDSGVVAVSHAAPVSLVIDHQDSSIIAGTSQTYMVTGEDAFSNTWDATTTTDFSIGSGASCTANVCTSTQAAGYRVTATDHSNPDVFTSTGLTVDPAALVSLTINHQNSSIVAGTSQTYTVTGHDTYGNTWDATSTSDFSIGAGASCTLNVCTSNTVAGYTVQAADHTTPSILVTTGLTFTHAALYSLTIDNQDSSIVAGTSQTYTVTGNDTYGNTWNANSTTNFTIGADASCTLNVCTSTNAAGYTVTATDKGNGSITTSTGLTVTHALPVSLTVNNLNSTIAAGDSQTYTVTGHDTYGNTWDATSTSDFSIGAGASCTDNSCTSTIPNGYTVTATDHSNPSVFVSTGLTVTHAAPVSLAINNQNSSIVAGTSQTYTVTGHDTYGNTWDATSTSDFTVGAGASCTLNVCTSNTVAGYTVQAADHTTPSVLVTTGLTVTHAALDSLTINHQNSSIAAGTSQTYTVTGHDTYSNTWDATLTSDFTIGAGASCTLNVCTSTTAAGYTVQAADHTIPSILITTGLTVTHAALHNLAITTNNPTTVAADAAHDYTVTAQDQYGNTDTDYTGTVTISTTDLDTNVVLPAPAGLTSGVGVFSVTLLTLGSETVSANDGSLAQVDQPVTVVTAVTASKLVITAGSSTAVVGDGGHDYTVTAEYSNGNTVGGYNLTVTVTSSDGLASIDSPKLLTNGVGTFHVTFGTAGAQTVTAHDANVGSTAYAVAVSAFGPATKFTVAGASSTAANVAQNYVVRAFDTWNHPVPTYGGTVRITSSDNAAILPANAGLASGVGTFSVTFLTAGSQSVIATDTVTSATGSQAGITVTRTSSTYHPIAPVRLVDTRTGAGLAGGIVAKMKAATPVTFHIGGRSGITANAVAVTVNVTVVHPSAASFVYLGPVANAHPSTFTIAFNKNDITAYGSTVALSDSGTIFGTYMAASGTTDLVLDVTGFFTPDTTGDTYHPLTPYRVVDTRYKNGLTQGKLRVNVPQTFTVKGRGGVPTDAKAVTGNVTVTNANSSWAVYIGPLNTATPTTSTINFAKGQTRANSLTVQLSATGTLSVVFLGNARSTTDLVFDVTGYYTADLTGTKYVPVNPVALLNTGSSIGLSGRFTANTPRAFTVRNGGGVPLTATGVTGIVSVVAQTNSWAIFVGPDLETKPTTSALNFLKGDNCSNGFTVALSGTGTLGVTYLGGAGNTTNVIVIVTGYFVP